MLANHEQEASKRSVRREKSKKKKKIDGPPQPRFVPQIETTVFKCAVKLRPLATVAADFKFWVERFKTRKKKLRYLDYKILTLKAQQLLLNS